jgi:hypothetical protein
MVLWVVNSDPDEQLRAAKQRGRICGSQKGIQNSLLLPLCSRCLPGALELMPSPLLRHGLPSTVVWGRGTKAL